MICSHLSAPIAVVVDSPVPLARPCYCPDAVAPRAEGREHEDGLPMWRSPRATELMLQVRSAHGRGDEQKSQRIRKNLYGEIRAAEQRDHSKLQRPPST